MKNKVLKVNEVFSNNRLDVFLSKELGISRSQAQKMIGEDLVTVNGKLPKKAGDRLSEGSAITVSLRGPQGRGNPLKLTRADSGGSSRPLEWPQDDTVLVVTETPDYIVVDKPSGLLTHPTEANEPDTLSNRLVKKYPEINKVGEDPMRPGIVHRLDKEASGLLVVARTQKMFNHLKEQFKNRAVDKEYLVLAHGKMPVEWGELTFRIARGKDKERMVSLPLTKKGLTQEAGKEATTELTVEKQFANCALVRVKLHTGRMHQIRVHFLAYGHPVVGDPLYFSKKQKRKQDEKLGRLFLHCVRLGFANLNGERMAFESKLPTLLEFFLKNLK